MKGTFGGVQQQPHWQEGEKWPHLRHDSILPDKQEPCNVCFQRAGVGSVQ